MQIQKVLHHAVLHLASVISRRGYRASEIIDIIAAEHAEIYVDSYGY